MSISRNSKQKPWQLLLALTHSVFFSFLFLIFKTLFIKIDFATVLKFEKAFLKNYIPQMLINTYRRANSF